MKHTEAEILEGVCLLAKFDRHPRFDDYSSERQDNVIRNTPYHESWDLMFGLIDKINGLGKAYSFATFKTYISLTVEKSGNKMYKDFSFAHAEYITAEQTSKEAAFKLLVRFIKWHNEHVKQTENV
jgi:hypothetical protein